MRLEERVELLEHQLNSIRRGYEMLATHSDSDYLRRWARTQAEYLNTEQLKLSEGEEGVRR